LTQVRVRLDRQKICAAPPVLHVAKMTDRVTGCAQCETALIDSITPYHTCSSHETATLENLQQSQIIRLPAQTLQVSTPRIGCNVKKKNTGVRGNFDSKLHHISGVSQHKVAFWKFIGWLNTFRSFERWPGLNFQGCTVLRNTHRSSSIRLCENLKFRILNP